MDARQFGVDDVLASGARAADSSYRWGRYPLFLRRWGRYRLFPYRLGRRAPSSPATGPIEPPVVRTVADGTSGDS
ncbi:hypothetical protein EL22_19680 [Halostagnicola sp. A56]|uniref:hypothetical protein n=1 Tax=Halostagnicola sp. A56 TaxID=1495067 RepID=UPI00049F19E5|nr:hypothetical protein [Halostagnicola sp. A56]KDE60514.1 hypothetical protein EL22_19680 [Halostagnicola sp. A56]